MFSKLVFSLASFTVLISGCTTLPSSTGYVEAPSASAEGYSIQSGPDFLTATYRGNPHTIPRNAAVYAVAASIEHCLGQGQLPMLLDSFEDLSQTTSYTAVSTESLPTYANNQYAVQDRVRTQRVNETRPVFASRFLCRKFSKDFLQNPTVKPVAAEMVHVFTRDFKGGLAVTPSEENKNGLVAGDVLTSIAGSRVASLTEYYKILDSVPADKPSPLVLAEVVRNGKIKKLNLRVVDDSDLYRTRFVNTLIKTICEQLRVEERKNIVGSTRTIASPEICKNVISERGGKPK